MSDETIQRYFEACRDDRELHLGFGDIRLTIWMQQKVEDMHKQSLAEKDAEIERLREERNAYREFWYWSRKIDKNKFIVYEASAETQQVLTSKGGE